MSAVIAIVGSSVIGGVASYKGAGKQADAANNATDAQIQMHRDDLEQQKQFNPGNLELQKGNIALQQGNLRMLPYQELMAHGNALLQQGDIETQGLNQQLTQGNIGLQKGNQQFQQGGLTAQNRLLDVLGLSGNTGAQGYGQYAKDFGESDFKQDPGYAFRLSEGLKALDRQAASRGGLISGSALKAAQGYGQEQASQEYQNAFNRYQTNRQSQLGALQNMMAAGQGQAGSAGQSMAGNSPNVNTSSSNAMNYGFDSSGASRAIGDTMTQSGNARASAYTGVANSLNSGLSNYLNYQQAQDYLPGNMDRAQPSYKTVGMLNP